MELLMPLGGYLVQRHLQARTAPRAMLLASLPPSVPRTHDLFHVMAEVYCSNSHAILDSALTGAPHVDVRAVLRTPLVVLASVGDRVVPMPWVRYTAVRYGVEPRFVDAGHLLMLGRSANAVILALAAS